LVGGVGALSLYMGLGGGRCTSHHRSGATRRPARTHGWKAQGARTHASPRKFYPCMLHTSVALPHRRLPRPYPTCAVRIRVRKRADELMRTSADSIDTQCLRIAFADCPGLGMVSPKRTAHRAVQPDWICICWTRRRQWRQIRRVDKRRHRTVMVHIAASSRRRYRQRHSQRGVSAHRTLPVLPH